MSTRKNHLCSFLSRLALCALGVALILLSPALVRADAITTFAVSGTAQNVSGIKLDSCASGATCAFSGMFQVDTTSGLLLPSGFDITFPGLGAFNSVTGSVSANPFQGRWDFGAENSSSDGLTLDFFTAPALGSLVGLTGGTIDGLFSFVTVSVPLGTPYDILGGSITTVSTVITPEPSSMILFATGMLVLGLARRFGKKVGHPLSA